MKIVVVHFTELQEVLTRLRTSLYLQVNHDVAQRRLQKNGHCFLLLRNCCVGRAFVSSGEAQVAVDAVVVRVQDARNAVREVGRSGFRCGLRVVLCVHSFKL